MYISEIKEQYIVINKLFWARLQVLVATRMKISLVRNVSPCSLVDTDRHFRSTYCFHQGDGSSIVLRFIAVQSYCLLLLL
jgi:hypothetical protein